MEVSKLALEKLRLVRVSHMPLCAPGLNSVVDHEARNIDWSNRRILMNESLLGLDQSWELRPPVERRHASLRRAGNPQAPTGHVHHSRVIDQLGKKLVGLFGKRLRGVNVNFSMVESLEKS